MPGGEDQVVLLDFYHVASLVCSLRRDLLVAERPRAPVFKHSSRRFVRLLGRHAQQRFHFFARKGFAVARQMVVLFDDFHRLIHVLLLTLDGESRVVQVRAHPQRILEQAHIFIQRAKKGFNFSGNVNGTSHPSGRSS